MFDIVNEHQSDVYNRWFVLNLIFNVWPIEMLTVPLTAHKFHRINLLLIFVHETMCACIICIDDTLGQLLVLRILATALSARLRKNASAHTTHIIFGSLLMSPDSILKFIFHSYAIGEYASHSTAQLGSQLILPNKILNRSVRWLFWMYESIAVQHWEMSGYTISIEATFRIFIILWF